LGIGTMNLDICRISSLWVKAYWNGCRGSIEVWLCCHRKQLCCKTVSSFYLGNSVELVKIDYSQISSLWVKAYWNGCKGSIGVWLYCYRKQLCCKTVSSFYLGNWTCEPGYLQNFISVSKSLLEWMQGVYRSMAILLSQTTLL
jgi:hypothetical protein